MTIIQRNFAIKGRRQWEQQLTGEENGISRGFCFFKMEKIKYLWANRNEQ